MGQAILPGDPPIEIILRRSSRARRLSLRVSRLDGRVTLSLPRWTAEREALDFARAKEGWIRQNLDARPCLAQPRIGGTIPLEGADVPIRAATLRAARLENGALHCHPDRTAPQVAAFLKATARERLVEATYRHAAALGRGYRRITLRDTRSRWGSCSCEGNLMYSWRLVMAPPAVLDYVAAHEVAHLAEMNHSPRFWAVVERLCPGYRAHRLWLRREGQALHRWQF